MASSRGSIPERVRRALYVLSRGRCYAPACTEPVVVIDAEEAVFVGEVAHIVAATADGPRGRESVSDREAFSNLLLLCGRHHKMIDNPQNSHRYPSTDLRKWKTQREVEFDAQTLAELDQLGPIGKYLPRLLVDTLKLTMEQLSAEVDRLEGAGQLANETATLLRMAVDHMPEDTGDLYHAAVMLSNFADVMGDLHHSAITLSNFADVMAGQLPAAAQSLGQLAEVDLYTLSRAADRIATLTDGDGVTRLVQDVEIALSRIPHPDEYRQAGKELRAAMPTVRRDTPLAAATSKDREITGMAVLGALGIGLLAGAISIGMAMRAHANGNEEDRQACTGASVPAKFTVKRMVEREVNETPSLSPSPFTCETWYPQPISSPKKK